MRFLREAVRRVGQRSGQACTSCLRSHVCACGRPELCLSHPQVGLEWPLESVSYTVRGPSQHELQPPPGGPGALSLRFLNPQEAQRWAALVRGATAEGHNGQCCGAKVHSVGQGLCWEGGSLPGPQAWMGKVVGKVGPTAGRLGRPPGESGERNGPRAGAWRTRLVWRGSASRPRTWGEDTESRAAGKYSAGEEQVRLRSSRLAATCTRGRVQRGLGRRTFPEMLRR